MRAWTLRQLAAPVVVGLGLLVGSGCGLLDVSDPTAVEDDELDGPLGAATLSGDALRTFSRALATDALAGGILADEFLSTRNGNAEDALDRRESERYEQLTVNVFFQLNEVRRASTIALTKVLPYGTDVQAGAMYAVRGLATLRLAEDVCPGFAVHEVVELDVVIGSPLTTDQVFERALADFDSALTYANAAAPAFDLARVGRARTLLGLGRFADARIAAADVATPFVYEAAYSTTTVPNPLGTFGQGITPALSVVDREGGIGLDFVTAADPRVRTTFLRLASNGVTRLYAPAKYPNANAPIVVASGIEARLIEAEAALRAGEPSWLTTLNDLRATAITPALPPLAEPATDEARVDLLFRERAFWLFGTGHRLGDLRRLLARYGRASETVLPTGGYWRGGVYSTATSIPFPARTETRHNAAITGCTSR